MSLIMALVFMVIVGLLVSILLGLVFTANNTNKGFRQQRVVRNNAESALNTAVAYLKRNPTLGITANDDCSFNFKMEQDNSGATRQAFSNGSFLRVTCTPTDPASGAGGIDDDGGQRTRDVTLEVTCNEVVGYEPLYCLPAVGTSLRVVARARVRFEADYSVVDNPATTSVDERAQRAYVPKIVTWDIYEE